MALFIVGVDVGGTNIKIGLFQKDSMQLIEKFEYKTPQVNQEHSILETIYSEITGLLARNFLSMTNLYGVGLAVPCPVKDGYVATCPNLSWKNIDLINKMEVLFPEHVKFAVSNDASIAALGENESLEIPYQNAVLFTMGTGIGGGVIIDGKIYEGSHGFGGEIGHMHVYNEDNLTCGCGSKGCLEQICGTKGILDYVRHLAQSEHTIIDLNRLSVKAVFDAAKKGDGVGIKTVERVAHHIAISASIIAMIVDPEVFIIGGGISKAGNYLIDLIEKHYKSVARFSTGKIPFILAKTGNDAGIIGAAHFIEKFK